ncbi:hypothetical protein DRQ53_04975 [bacterium]|nr:MAG: hypothetical protein DRQ53_04975 [bacterium]
MSATRVIGMMVGTSLDGIDAARVHFDPEGHATLEEFETADFSEVSTERLREIASGGATTAAQLSQLGFALARDHVRALELVDPEHAAMLIGAHGVTVAHAPGDPGDPGSQGGHGWQLLNGAALAALSGRDVACDFRSADIALGGQGAPLAPVADLRLRADQDEDRIILNLGGIANFTAIPAAANSSGDLHAGDAGPANLVLDAWMRRISGGTRHFDAGGELAAHGEVDPDVVARMLEDAWFSLPLGRSGGREQFGEHWLEAFLQACPVSMDDADRMATLVAISVAAIADQIASLPADWRRGQRTRMLVTGGGRHNRALMHSLTTALGDLSVEPIESIGENGDAKEAVDFAWLALMRARGTHCDLAALTGAGRDCVAGALYSGSGVGE